MKEYQARRPTEDDLIQMTSLEDKFVSDRTRHSCVLCDEEGKSQAMSLCCRLYNCIDCYQKFWNDESVQCIKCDMNWAAFNISDVLLSPPIEQDVESDSLLKKKLKLQWKDLVIKTYDKNVSNT